MGAISCVLMGLNQDLTKFLSHRVIFGVLEYKTSIPKIENYYKPCCHMNFYTTGTLSTVLEHIFQILCFKGFTSVSKNLGQTGKKASYC